MTDINPLDFGAKADGSDSTAAIQAAINAASSGDSVVIPAATFMVDGNLNCCLRLKSDMGLRLSAGAVLAALPNPDPHYTIVSINGVKNSWVSGSGLIRGERDLHQPPDVPGQYGTGGWGFGIAITGGATDIGIFDISIQKCWGDGLYIQNGRNIAIDGLHSNYNRRHGMAVTECHDLTIRNSSFQNSNIPVHPGSGIDFEPDINVQTIENVIIEFCQFSNNQGPSLSFCGPGIFSDIRVRECQFDHKTQPILVAGNAGSLNTPWWAWLLNRTVGSWGSPQNAPSYYRWWGYPTEWTKA